MAKIILEQGAVPPAPAAGKSAVAIDENGQIVAVSAAATAVMPQSVTLTLSSAEILALADTPIEAVAAPGAGKFAFITSVVLGLTAGATPYDDAGASISVGIPGTTQFLTTLDGFLDQATDQTYGDTADTLAGATADLVNQPLKVSADINPTAGDGTLAVTVTYVILDA